MMNATSGTDIAVPTRDPESKMLVAKARSRTGNQRETTLVLLGYAALSPIPSPSRSANNDAKPAASAVSAVNNDHHNTPTEYMIRGPSLSTNQPEGSWKTA